MATSICASNKELFLRSNNSVMKITFLLPALFILLIVSSCQNNKTTVNEKYIVKTVPPEIGPAQQFGTKIDNAVDSVKADAKQTKEEVKQIADTAKKNLKSGAEKIKAATNKTADNISKTTKSTTETIKKEAGKAATNVKKAAKDVKKDLSR